MIPNNETPSFVRWLKHVLKFNFAINFNCYVPYPCSSLKFIGGSLQPSMWSTNAFLVTIEVYRSHASRSREAW